MGHRITVIPSGRFAVAAVQKSNVSLSEAAPLCAAG